jgi:hypothetical protein
MWHDLQMFGVALVTEAHAMSQLLSRNTPVNAEHLSIVAQQRDPASVHILRAWKPQATLPSKPVLTDKKVLMLATSVAVGRAGSARRKAGEGGLTQDVSCWDRRLPMLLVEQPKYQESSFSSAR